MSFSGIEPRDEKFEMGRVVSRTFGTIGRNAVSFFTLTLIAVLPQLILGAYLGVGVTAGRPKIDPSQLLHFWSMMGIVSLVAVVLGAVLQAALVHGTISDLNGKKASFADCLQTGLSTCLPVIGLSILLAFALVIGFVVLIVPGILMFLAWAVVVPVLVVERTGVFAAFGRSADLTKGHRWAILGLAVVVWLISFLLSLAIAPLQGFLAPPGGGITSIALSLVVSGAISVFTTALIAAGTAAVYYELRSIKEGIGPEQLATVFD